MDQTGGGRIVLLCKPCRVAQQNGDVTAFLRGKQNWRHGALAARNMLTGRTRARTTPFLLPACT